MATFINILGLLFSSITVLGQYNLQSNVGDVLLGEYCPDTTITIVCNARDINSPTISFYTNDNLVSQYIYEPNDQYPKTVELDHNSQLNAAVKISSVNVNNSRISYNNFTLMTNLSSLNTLRGQNITCGVIAERSNPFRIENFTTPTESIQNLSFLAKYQDQEGEFDYVNITWTDVFQLANCEITTLYSIQIKDDEGKIQRQVISTEDCNNTQCFVLFSSLDLDEIVKSYETNIEATNPWINNNFTFTSTIWNTTGNSINIVTCNDTAFITCSTIIDENCSVILTNTFSDDVLMSGETSSFLLDTIPQDIEIIIHSNSTILVQTLKYDPDRGNSVVVAILAVGLVTFLFGFISLILGFLFGVINVKSCKCKNFKKDYCITNLVGFILGIIGIVTLIISLILWILSRPIWSDSCLNEQISQDSIPITALVLSIALLLLGSLVFGAFMMAYICKRRHTKKSSVDIHGGDVDLFSKYDFSSKVNVRSSASHQPAPPKNVVEEKEVTPVPCPKNMNADQVSQISEKQSSSTQSQELQTPTYRDKEAISLNVPDCNGLFVLDGDTESWNESSLGNTSISTDKQWTHHQW